MGDPTVVYGNIAWDLYGPYLFTASLKVSYQLITSQGIWLPDKSVLWMHKKMPCNGYHASAHRGLKR